MSQPLFSVVIPLYNKSSDLNISIGSAISQTVSNIEIIVVDDGSTDDSVVVAKSIGDSRIRIIQQTNRGQAAARNVGIFASTGRYVAFLDADDYWSSTHLDELRSIFLTHGDLALAASTAFAYDKSGAVIRPQLSDLHISAGKLQNYIEVLRRSTSPITTNSVAIERLYAVQIGGFDESLRIAQDIDLWLRINDDSGFFYSEHVTSFYRLDGTNRVTTKGSRNIRYMSFIDKLSASISSGILSKDVWELKLLKSSILQEVAWSAAYTHDVAVRQRVQDRYPDAWHAKHGFVWALTSVGLVRPLFATFARIVAWARRTIVAGKR